MVVATTEYTERKHNLSRFEIFLGAAQVWVYRLTGGYGVFPRDASIAASTRLRTCSFW